MKDILSSLHIIHMTTKTDISENIYKKYKAEYSKQIKIAKRQSNVEFLNNAANKSKAAWQIINSSLNLKPRANNIAQVTADEFNEHFVSVPKLLSDAVSNDSMPEATKYEALKSRGFSGSFFIKPTDEAEVLRVIQGLKDSAAEDAYGLTAKVLKYVAPIIAAPLASAINKCFVQGYFPEQLKVSKILPLHKKGSIEEVGNYRPIAIIPVLAKIIEKLLKSRLVSYFEGNALFCKEQFGYRENSSSMKALVNLVEGVFTSFNRGEKTSALLMDLSRAFDCVNHDKLLSKLRHYGIRGIAHELFRSYLSGRRQFVSVCSGVSDFLSVDIGVPQGSILGPILFLVYMNDLPANLTNCCTILFADDTTIINSELNEETLCERHRLNMAEAERWFGCNGLKLNTEKTQRIQFMPRPGASSSVKLLGVLVDSGLRWKEHINFLAGALNASIYQIRKTSEILNCAAARMLYFATFQSIVSYSVVLWGNYSGW